MRPRTCAIVVFCIVAATSGGSNAEPGGQDVPIRAGERLAWTQLADSADVRAYTFRLYVDGRVAELMALRCQVIRSPLSYECSGGLPSMNAGRHMLQLTSVFNGRESSRSEAFVVVVSGSTQIARLTNETPATDIRAMEPPGDSSQVCTTAPAVDECYEVRSIASGLGWVTALTSTADARILLVEGGTRLRIIAGGELIDEPALELPDKARIVGLGADPRPGESQTVYVAWVESTGSSSALNVTRYRELANSLGEGATIVTGLAFPSDQLAPMAVDLDGLLYIALPEGSVTSNGAGASHFGGAVLRYDRDGRIPDTGGQLSQVFSIGYAQPTSLAFDSTHKRLWLAGRSAASQSLSVLDIPASNGSTWPLRPNVVDTSRFAGDTGMTTLSALAFSRNHTTDAALFAADDRLLLSRPVPDRQLAPLGELSLRAGVPLGIAGDTTGSWYVAVVQEHGTSSVLRLTPRR